MSWAAAIHAAATTTAQTCGVKVVAAANWRTAGHGDVGPMQGVMWHDTVTPVTWADGTLLRLLSAGHATLAGPIANIGIGASGNILLVAARRAHHAGSGSYPGIGSGNANTVGIEVNNPGKGSGVTWTAKQRQVATRLSAELCKQAAIPPTKVIGHKEWTARKPDPWAVVMDQARRDVRNAMATSTPNDKEDDVALTQAEKAALAAIPKLQDDIAWIKRALGGRYEPGNQGPGTQLTVGFDLQKVRQQTAPKV